jgi:hypothetical protein
MDQYSLDPEFTSNGTSMLSSSTSEDTEYVVLRVEPSALSQCSNRAAHSLVGNPNKAQRDILNRTVFSGALSYIVRVNFICQLGECLKC